MGNFYKLQGYLDTVLETISSSYPRWTLLLFKGKIVSSHDAGEADSRGAGSWENNLFRNTTQEVKRDIMFTMNNGEANGINCS